LSLNLILKDIIKRVTIYKRDFLKGLFYGFLFIVVQVVRPFLLKKLIDRYIPSGEFTYISILTGIYLILLIVSIIAAYSMIIFISSIGIKVINELKADLFLKVLSGKKEYLDKTSTGAIIAKVESDTEQMKMLLSPEAINVVNFTALTIGICIFLIFIKGMIGVYFFIGYLIFSCGFIIILKKIKELYLRAREAYKEVFAFLAEYLRAIPVVQLFDVKDEVKERLEQLNEKRYQIRKNAGFFQYGFIAFLDFLLSGLIPGIVIYFSCGSIVRGQLTVGELIMLLEYVRMISGPLLHMSELLTWLQGGYASTLRVYRMINNIEVEDLKPEFSDKIQVKEKLAIEFNKVWFKYNKKDDTSWVLRDLSFKVLNAQKVGICGQSGAGKSTILKLLLEFYKPDKGKIFVNGRNIEEFNLYELRKIFGLVLQDVYFFPGTLLDNVRLFDEKINEDVVLEAIESVGLNRCINRLDKNIYTQVSHHGLNLSTGEKQLFSFIRATTRKPDILLLDEATAFIDVYTENIIQKAISKKYKNKTVLIIAHRLSTIKNADFILVLDKGILKEKGTHTELMQKRGLYYEMYIMQELTRNEKQEK